MICLIVTAERLLWLRRMNKENRQVPSAMAAGFFGSIFPAVWSFQLALRSRGLG